MQKNSGVSAGIEPESLVSLNKVQYKGNGVSREDDGDNITNENNPQTKSKGNSNLIKPPSSGNRSKDKDVKSSSGSSRSNNKKKASSGAKSKTVPSINLTNSSGSGANLPDPLPSPLKPDANSPRVHRSNSRHSLKRRNKENKEKDKDKDPISRQPTPATENSTANSETDQLSQGLQKVNLNSSDNGPSFIIHGRNPTIKEETASQLEGHNLSSSAGTLTSTLPTPSNSSPQLVPVEMQGSMPRPPFQFMPLQPNLYPLFMPAQMQDGRFVFVPVAYPMANGCTNSGYTMDQPHYSECGDGSSHGIPVPMMLGQPENRFYPSDNNYTPQPLYDPNDSDSTANHYRLNNNNIVPNSNPPYQPVFANPNSWSHPQSSMSPIPIIQPKIDQPIAPQYNNKPNNQFGTSRPPRVVSTPDYDQNLNTFDFSPEALDVINHEAQEIVVRLLPHPVEKERQDSLLAFLRNILRQIYPDAELHPFGSTANGLGMANADMDLCVCFPQHVDSKVTAVEFVEHMGSLLFKESCFVDIKPLTRTRIPIIKLKHKNGLCSDIGFENKLALWNTRLLRTYTEIDPRVKTLVYLVKHWSKQRNINEPYHGTLSSYCYVLMVIFFLQQRSPPVLPCLQTIIPPDLGHSPIVDLDGHNVYFFEDLPNLNRYWQANNTESITELLFGFFQYYAYNFHWSRSVVSVRSGAILTKDQKGWTKAKFSASPSTGASVADRFWLCVEDPFELDHNLGRPADRNSVFEIRGEFIRATKMLKSRDPSQALSRLFQLYSVAQDTPPQQYHGNYIQRAAPSPRRVA